VPESGGKAEEAHNRLSAVTPAMRVSVCDPGMSGRAVPGW
jgi:hypothetical protein